ncbi:alpha/beta fold hydrolase [uncultured Hydrogenophaga sp.]|uniref:alpha/beta fold hydrolase n=1 Tax=uncultured Hydrogenophaga sp. TaxID=199683 RepID=UPI0025875C46|nr:alpha/beta fold hydrolase [uncultured Hydrogenophaga sp.]
MQELEDATRHRLRVNGAELFATVSGPAGAPWVVLLNSLAADTSMWRAQVAALSRRYRVMCMDWRGHGASRDEPAPYSLDMLATDVREAMSALEVRRPHLAGTSLGGMIAMTLAIEQRLPLASLTVCSALPRITPAMAGWWGELAAQVRRDGVKGATVEGTISRWFTPAYVQTQPDVVEHTRRMIATTTTDAYVGCIAAFRNLDLFEELPRIDVPTLFLVGENDPASTPEIMRGMHERVPRSIFNIVRDAAHLPSLEQPEAVSRALLSFFDSIPHRTAS